MSKSYRGLIASSGLGLSILAAAAIAADPQGPASSQALPISEAQVSSGSQIFFETCSSCHGGELEGSAIAPPLKGGQFLTMWRGKTVADLLEFNAANMPPGAPATLTESQHRQVIAFILSRNGYAAGPTSLPEARADLAKLKIDPAAPGQH